MKMKFQWILVIVAVAVGSYVAFKQFDSINSSNKPEKVADTKSTSYWTCPMHPQVHLDHTGECPICHMKLVQVNAQEVKSAESNRSQIQATSDQLDLIGVQKEQVERMDLHLSIPVSGRLLSSSSIAFQIYESDLHFIQPGLTFSGQSSFVPDGEITGVITSVDSIVDPTSRTIRVIGRIQNGPKGLISETTFSGVVTSIRKNSVAIPESAVLHTGTGDLVYVFSEGNKLSARKIILGAKTEGFYEVVSGLEQGEYISSGPNFLIDSEAKIRGTTEGMDGKKTSTPSCDENEHWDIPMSMCMPGKSSEKGSSK
jgi:multidrug efflux pump subunit AcrA (membrane-fusion protein)